MQRSLSIDGFIEGPNGDGYSSAMVIHHNVLEEVKRLKDETGNISCFRRSWYCQEFSDMKLIDEYIFSVHPLILCSGKPLFSSMAQRLDLKLLAKEKLESGIVLLRYKP